MTTVINGQPAVEIKPGHPAVIQEATMAADLFANRPATAILNSIFMATDTGVPYVWNGTAWVAMATVRKAYSEQPDLASAFNVVPSASTSWPSGGWLHTVTLSGRAVRIELSAMIRENGAGASLQFGYLELWHTPPGGGASKIRETIVKAANDGGSDAYSDSIVRHIISAPAVGSHTFEAKVRQITGSSLDVYDPPAIESAGSFTIWEEATG